MFRLRKELDEECETPLEVQTTFTCPHEAKVFVNQSKLWMATQNFTTIAPFTFLRCLVVVVNGVTRLSFSISRVKVTTLCLPRAGSILPLSIIKKMSDFTPPIICCVVYSVLECDCSPIIFFSN